MTTLHCQDIIVYSQKYAKLLLYLDQLIQNQVRHFPSLVNFRPNLHHCFSSNFLLPNQRRFQQTNVEMPLISSTNKILKIFTQITENVSTQFFFPESFDRNDTGLIYAK